ncbi:MAG: glutamate racemase [Rikenellaceae bacterium]
MNNNPIGVFDSGIGGLTVLSAIRDLLPNEKLIYLGDGENCPYGSRPKEEIMGLVFAAVDHLLGMGCKMVVLACNTATAVAIEALRDKYPETPFVGMEPAIKPACLTTKSGVVGVIATRRSLEGGLYRSTVAKYGSNIEIIEDSARGFVELVEGDNEDAEDARSVVWAAISKMVKAGADEIVLGCTHFPFLLSTIRSLAPDTTIIDPAPAVARRVQSLLEQRDICSSSPEGGDTIFATFGQESYLERLKQKAKRYNSKL